MNKEVFSMLNAWSLDTVAYCLSPSLLCTNLSSF
jgi:hypothetical protein